MDNIIQKLDIVLIYGVIRKLEKIVIDAVILAEHIILKKLVFGKMRRDVQYMLENQVNLVQAEMGESFIQINMELRNVA